MSAERKATSPPREPIAALSAAVLAGGRSTRMGRDKALLTLGGEPLIRRAARCLATLSDDVMVVADDPARYAALVAARLVPDGGAGGEGPLLGLIAALEAARHPRLLVIPTDMPALTPALLRALASAAPEATAVVGQAAGRLEPLVACYHRRALPVLRAALAANRRSLMALLPALDARPLWLDTLAGADDPFRNLNTPAEWAAFEATFGPDAG